MYADQVFAIAEMVPEYRRCLPAHRAPTVNQGIGGVLFKTWAERSAPRDRAAAGIATEMESDRRRRVAAFQFPPLPGSQGMPVQFVISTSEPFENLNEVAQAVLNRARRVGIFFFVDSDLKLDEPEQPSWSIATRSRCSDSRTATWASARRGAGRRLCQLLLDRRPLVQGYPAGVAELPAESRQVLDLLPAHAGWHADSSSAPLRISSTRRYRNRSTTSSSSTPRPSPATPACRKARRSTFLRKTLQDVAPAATRWIIRAPRASSCKTPTPSSSRSASRSSSCISRSRHCSRAFVIRW